MKCIQCNAVMPFMEDYPTGFDCVFCEGKQYPDDNDLLSEPVLGFINEIRQGQIELAQGIRTTILNGDAAMYEAGTGVGKSFAYLLPAILSCQRTIISTAKKALQAQLLEKDLPHIKKHLQSINHPRSTFTYFAAYGKANYACFLRAHNEKGSTKDWKKYETFFQKSAYGRWDDSDRLHLKLDQSLNAEDCIGPDCRHYKSNCGYVKARNEMREADIVVTNNWLLGYHYKLRQEMPHFYLLGEFKHIIVDEAHKVEDGIRDAFTSQTNLNYTETLKRQFESLQASSNKKLELPELAQLAPVWADTFNELKIIHESGSNTLTERAEESVRDIIARLDQLSITLIGEDNLHTIFANPTADLHSLVISRYLPDNNATDKDNQEMITRGFPTNPDDQLSFIALDKFLNSLKTCKETFQLIIDRPPNRTWCIERNEWRGKVNYYLKNMPVNISAYLPDKHITYVSATLALDNKFDDFARRVGLSFKPFNSDIFSSPFDIKKQAHLFVPKAPEMPAPDTYGGEAQQIFREALSEHVYKLLYASQGDAFVLFSSKVELEHVKSYLHSKLFPYPIFAQGDFSAEDALTRYRETPKATILGLKSFWEGVDVSGDKLFLVIICKLPFPNARDPILKARKEAFDNSSDAFTFVDIPEMLFDLRQGVGRLIRSTRDRGMIAILDSRIHTKRYGKQVLRTIGLTPHSDLEKVCRGLATRHVR